MIEKEIYSMKVTVIGSHLCPDTLYALCKLTEKQADREMIVIIIWCC